MTMALLFVLFLLNQVPSVNAKVVGLLRGFGVPPPLRARGLGLGLTYSGSFSWQSLFFIVAFLFLFFECTIYHRR